MLTNGFLNKGSLGFLHHMISQAGKQHIIDLVPVNPVRIVNFFDRVINFIRINVQLIMHWLNFTFLKIPITK